MNTAPPADRFQILALDGGGIKGLFSAAVLAALERDLATNLTDHFDLITGTSTGGIIALGLGLGMRAHEIVEFYVKHGPTIFRNPCRLRSGVCLVHRKFPQEPLARALRDPAAFGDRLLGHSRKRLVIPSFNLADDDVYIFKTPHHARLRRDWRVPAWQVALATSAAPTYFPVCRHVDQLRLIDGGVWANNPTMVGIIEAVSMLGVKLDAIRVLSLGTTSEVVGRPTNLDAGGLWQWRNAAVDVILRGQSLGVQHQATHLLGQEAVCRVDTRVPEHLFALDRLAPDDLIARAAHASRTFCPDFAQRFADHTAAAYTPLYSPDARPCEGACS